MKNEEEADLLAQTDLKEKNLEPILPQFSAAVKRHDLRTALNVLTLQPREAVELLSRSFPSFDKTVLSKCSNPEKYGCVLHPAGYDALRTLIKEEDAPEQEQQDPQQPRKRRKSSPP